MVPRKRKDKKMDVKQKPLSFSITGEFLTELAREKLYEKNDFIGAMELLMDTVSSSDIDKEQQTIFALRVLDGTAAFVGTSGKDFYLELYEKSDPEYKNNIKGLSKWNKDLLLSLEQLQTEKRKLEEKYAFLIDNLEIPWYKLSELNDLWKDEGHEEPLFQGIPESRCVSAYGKELMSMENENHPQLKTMLDEYIEQQASGRDDDYGWLSPEGKFYPVEWGNHGEWARNWLKTNCPDWIERYQKFPNCPKYPEPEDFMKQVLHWVLIHSPSQGLPRHTLYPGQELRKKQKEFLIDFYEKRKMREEAAFLLNND